MSIYNSKKGVQRYIKMCEGYDGQALHNLIKKFIPTGRQLLELGSGPGNDVEFLSSHFTFIGSDFSSHFLDTLQERFTHLSFIKLDAGKVEMPPPVDCIFSNKVLHHLTDDDLESGRFGRITKNLRKQGYEKKMEDILYDSKHFQKLKTSNQTQYVETIVDRMEQQIGIKNTEKVLFECGVKCCGKSWYDFVKRIWDSSETLTDFFINLNKEEEKYHTKFSYEADQNLITVERSKCICGLINKGKTFKTNKSYCKCSHGHMSVFFNTVFSVKEIQLKQSIYSGSEKCTWKIQLNG